jgi:hypothetical protein
MSNNHGFPLMLAPTQRGFLRAEFYDLYGSKCSIQESSLADTAAIWFGVETDFEKRECTRMHLTPEMVREMLPLLEHFAKNGSLDISP